MRSALKLMNAGVLSTDSKPAIQVPIWFEEHSWPAKVQNRKRRKKPLTDSLMMTGWFRRPRP